MIKREFKARVGIERKVLGLLNDACGAPCLTGLSFKALDRWKSTNPTASRDLVSVLEKISLRTRLDADGSRDVFDPEDVKSLGAIGHLVEQLDACLREALVVGTHIETEINR